MKRVRQTLWSYLLLTLACGVYAVSFNWCYSPSRIGFGGITGVGQIVNALLPWAPIGVVVILLNVPLFLLGWRLLGGHLLVSSLYAMALSSVLIDLLAAWHTFDPMEPMLAAIFGGVLLGLALGVVFLQGATTGGTDLCARLLKLKLTWLPVGRLLLAVDLLVIVATAVTFHSLDSALYGLVSLYISTIVMDGVLYGTDKAKVAYIISDRSQDIAQAITRELERGVTVLHGEGAWSGAEKRVLLCAFKQRQIVPLKQRVKEIDPDAFLIVCDAREVLGDGFRSYRQNDL